VYNFHLLPYLKEKLQQTKSAYGEQLFNEAMSTLDSVVAKQLMTLISWYTLMIEWDCISLSVFVGVDYYVDFQNEYNFGYIGKNFKWMESNQVRS